MAGSFRKRGQGQVPDGIFATCWSTFREPARGASGNSGSFSLKILQPFVGGSVVIPPMALARLFECYNIPAGDPHDDTLGSRVLPVCMYQSLGSCSVNAGETIEVDLGDVFAANFRVVGHKPLGPERQNLQFRSGVTRETRG